MEMYLKDSCIIKNIVTLVKKKKQLTSIIKPT